jgi:hypothetical protein
MLNIFGLVMFIATAALLVWSSIRAWEVKNNFFKWGGVSLTALLAAAASFVSVLTIAGLLKLHARSARFQTLRLLAPPNKFSVVRLSPIASVALAIQKPAHSPAAWASANISHSQ